MEYKWFNESAPVMNKFVVREMQCPCCGLVIVKMALVCCLGELRAAFEKPIIATSWTRCLKHEIEVSGKAWGGHMTGDAVDLVPEEGITEGFVLLCRAYFPFILVYGDHVHCDTRGRDYASLQF